MHPEEVWVVFNNVQCKVLEVFAIEHMAEQRVYWYWSSEDAPCSGTTENHKKIELCTLAQAIYKIKENEKYYGTT